MGLLFKFKDVCLRPFFFVHHVISPGGALRKYYCCNLRKTISRQISERGSAAIMDPIITDSIQTNAAIEKDQNYTGRCLIRFHQLDVVPALSY